MNHSLDTAVSTAFLFLFDSAIKHHIFRKQSSSFLKSMPEQNVKFWNNKWLTRSRAYTVVTLQNVGQEEQLHCTKRGLGEMGAYLKILKGSKLNEKCWKLGKLKFLQFWDKNICFLSTEVINSIFGSAEDAYQAARTKTLTT